MCILLYVKPIWCSGITQIYGQLEERGLGICAFFYTQIYGQLEGALVYVHSAICETYLMQWYYIYLWSIGGEGLGICVFFYM